MQTFAECLLMYRQRLRQILWEAGVPSNPAVDDSWILDRVKELFSKREPAIYVAFGDMLGTVKLVGPFSDQETANKWRDRFWDLYREKFGDDRCTPVEHVFTLDQKAPMSPEEFFASVPDQESKTDYLI